jgi:hypothetical protein
MLPISLARQNISAVRRSVSGARVVAVTELREAFFAKSTWVMSPQRYQY